MNRDILKQALKEILNYYEAQGMAGKTGFGERPAVIVTDFQKGITDPGRPAGCNLDVEIENTALLLSRTREKNIPAFFFVIAYDPSLADAGLLLKKVPALSNFTRGSDSVSPDPRLKPRPGEPVIAKQYASCFHGTPLAASLTAMKVDTVIITGCVTSGCIRATANDAMQHGFRAILPRECIGDRAAIPHEVNLMDIQARCGDVVFLKEVLDYIDSRRPDPGYPATRKGCNMKDIPTKAIMTSPAVSITARASLRQLVRILDRNRFSGLPVVDKDKKVVGVVSEKDLLKYTRSIIGQPLRDPAKLLKQEGESASVTGQRGVDVIEFVASATVKTLMTTDIIVAKEDTPVLDVVRLMNENKVNRIPVVDDAGRLSGIVTRADILRRVEEWANIGMR